MGLVAIRSSLPHRLHLTEQAEGEKALSTGPSCGRDRIRTCGPRDPGVIDTQGYRLNMRTDSVRRIRTKAVRAGMLAAMAVITAVTVWLSYLPAAAGTSNGPRPIAEQTSPSPTPSQTASPTPSPTPTADPDFRRVTLSASRGRVGVGRRVVLSGHIQANRIECSIASPVTVRRMILGTSKNVPIASTTTDENGDFRTRERARWNAVYTAVAPRSAGCRREESNPVLVRVSVRFSVRISDSTPQRFTNFRINGRLRPSHPGSEVLLQRKKRDRWVTIQRQPLSPQSTYSFFPLASWQGRRDFRIKWPQADRDHTTGTSRTSTIRTS